MESDMELVKGVIELLDPEVAAANQWLEPVMPVQFNPGEVRLRKAVDYAQIRVPGLDSPILQFIGGTAEVFELELFFDTTKPDPGAEDRDVTRYTEPLRQLTKVQAATHAPPRVRFTWGPSLSFTGVVVSLDQKLTLFSPAGVPLRAEVRLMLKESTTLADQLRDRNRKIGDRGNDWSKLAAPDTEGLSRAGAPGEGGAPADTEAEIDLSVPLLEVRSDGEPLDVEFPRDLRQATYRDRLDSRDEFELTLDNWDEKRRAFTYDDADRLEPGRKIEIRFGYRGPTPRSATVGGTIEIVRLSFSPDRGAELVISGSGARRMTTRSPTRQPVHRLAWGESLLAFEPIWEPAEGHGLTATGSTVGLPGLRAGTLLSIGGVGSRSSGRYLVTATTHSIGDSGYTTRFECRREAAPRPTPTRSPD